VRVPNNSPGNNRKLFWQEHSWLKTWHTNLMCRDSYLLPYLHNAGFKNLTREFISQLKFPSEVAYGNVC
jgi:hypothetical protein